ncbi:thioredoxin-disulfide reductase [Candidatus Saccharibacteria bacterium]|nr:thioredoxin-disulfide reductase [Candidatus Saccharibacteria bacterium]
MYDVIIIGAGTAGLTAAIYAARANKKVIVLEGKTYGGQIITTFNIENYPATPHISGVDFAKQLYAQAVELGAEVEFEEVLAVKKIEGAEESSRLMFEVETEDDKYEAPAVILATGSEDKRLGLKNEEEFTGRGVSYCATCDGAIYKGEEVAVVGGGNTALYDTLYLSDVAKKVYLIHRRDEFRGDPALVDKIKKHDNVEFVMDTQVTEIKGEKKLESIELTNKNGEKKELKVSALFVAIGRTPATAAFANLVELDDGGYIVADESCLTSTPGIFAAGDVRTKSLRQLVTATADGAVAGNAAAELS